MMNNLYGSIISKIQNKKPIQPESGVHVSFINHFTYLQWRRENLSIDYLDKIYVDGIMLCFFIYILERKAIERASFDDTSVAHMVFNYCMENKKNVYLIGSTENSNLKASKNIAAAYPGIVISGRRNGYFNNEDEIKHAIEDIVLSNADFVIIGMGAGAQENFQRALKEEKNWHGSSYTCGGYLHQSAKKVKYFPKIINKLHLRWAYRIWDEPALMRRYFISYPIASFYFVIDAIKNKINV